MRNFCSDRELRCKPCEPRRSSAGAVPRQMRDRTSAPWHALSRLDVQSEPRPTRAREAREGPDLKFASGAPPGSAWRPGLAHHPHVGHAHHRPEHRAGIRGGGFGGHRASACVGVGRPSEHDPRHRRRRHGAREEARALGRRGRNRPVLGSDSAPNGRFGFAYGCLFAVLLG
jgi:hypothetical protein